MPLFDGLIDAVGTVVVEGTMVKIQRGIAWLRLYFRKLFKNT